MPTTIALQNKINSLEAKYKACTGRSAYTIGNQLRSLKYDLRESLITDLSNKFSQIVRDNFSKEDLATVNDLNKQSDYKGCCALHDFCDANMLMDESFTVVIGREIDLQNEEDVYLWSNAWDIARDKQFKG